MEILVAKAKALPPEGQREVQEFATRRDLTYSPADSQAASMSAVERK
jgi:hypothetical protein